MNTKFQTAKKAIAFWALILSGVIITLNMNACGKKDGNQAGGPGGAPIIPGSVCPTCPVAPGTQLKTAFGQNSEVATGLIFVAQGSGAQSGTYQGPVSATGFFQIKTPFSCNLYVAIPAGIYGVNTVTPGNWWGSWGSAIVKDVRIQANGPAQMNIIVGPTGYSGGVINGLQSPVIGPNGETYDNYLASDLVIESVNGQPCNVYGPLKETIN